MTEPAVVVLYEERDGVAFVTLNRPEKIRLFCRIRGSAVCWSGETSPGG